MSPLDFDTGRARGYNNRHIFSSDRHIKIPPEEALRRGQARRRLEDLQLARELGISVEELV